MSLDPVSQSALARPSRPWPAGSATGVGSLPGTDARDAVRLVLDTLPDLPHLPELPARGPGSEMTGRALVIAGQIGAEWGSSGWVATDRPGRDLRRGESWLRQDLDTLEELLDGWDGPLKLQVCGPWTLAATVELRSGRRALADDGAVRDLTQALAEGLAAHVLDVAGRVPRASLLVQLDEPALPHIVQGSIPTASGLSTLAAVDTEVVERGLRAVLAALPGEVLPMVHCCASKPPLGLLVAAGAKAVSVDATLLDDGDGDLVAETLEAGAALLLGVVDARQPDLPTVGEATDRVRRLWHVASQPEESVRDVATTPTCGLAGSTPETARAVLERCREVAQALADDPERPHD